MAEPGYYSTPMGPAGPKKKMEKVPKTMRFTLEITDSNELSCPEFSWLKLLREAADNDEEKLKECMDPFAAQDLEEQKKLEVLARSFEEKYKKMNIGKRKKKIKFQDLLDMGDGYDETDPFVDNSEAYDELVPETLTTKLGGFYINSGHLDFKEVPIEHSDDEIVIKKKKRKLTIESDSESASGSSTAEVKKKKRLHKKNKQDGGISSSDSDKKRKKILSGEEILKKKKLEKAKKLKKAALNSESRLAPSKIKQNGTKPVQNGPSSLDSTFEATFESVLSQSQPTTPVKAPPSKPTSPVKSTSAVKATPPAKTINSVANESMETETHKTWPENAPSLPSDLPAGLEKSIDKLKVAARHSAEGKCKFFTNDINRVLLSIELECRQLSCGQRSSIYTHLAAFLPCGKETLIKRAKKLRETDQDSKMKNPINNLKEAIAKMMPALLEKYEKEVQEAAIAKPSEEKCPSKEGAKEEGASTAESDADEEEKAQNGIEKKRCHLPRKKFVWNDEIRKLLCEVVLAKMQIFDLTKYRTQSSEDHLKAFLEAEIKPLWPKGWVQTRILVKESRSAHLQWTAANARPRKSLILAKSQGLTPTPPNSLPALSVREKKEAKTPQPDSKADTRINNDHDEGMTAIFSMLDESELDSGRTLGSSDMASILSSFLDSQDLPLEELDAKPETRALPKPITEAKVAKLEPQNRPSVAPQVKPNPSAINVKPTLSSDTVSSKTGVPPSGVKSGISSGAVGVAASLSSGAVGASAILSSGGVTKSTTMLPPSNSSKSATELNFLAQFEKFARQSRPVDNNLSPEKRAPTPTGRAPTPTGRASTPNFVFANSMSPALSANSQSPQDIKSKVFPETAARHSPPKVTKQYNSESPKSAEFKPYHSSLTSSMADKRTLAPSIVEPMNNFSTFSQQKPSSQTMTTSSSAARSVWSGALSPNSMPTYIASGTASLPNVGYPNKLSADLQSKMAAADFHSKMAADLQSKMAADLQSKMATDLQTKMAASLRAAEMQSKLAAEAEVEHSRVLMDRMIQVAAQRQTLGYMDQTPSAPFGDSTLRSASSMYGMPGGMMTALTRQSPQQSAHSTHGLYGGQSPGPLAAPLSSSVNAMTVTGNQSSPHALINQHTLSPHQYRHFQPDKQPRPY